MIHTRLKEWPRSRFICTVDPITLTGLALAGLAGGGAAAAASGAFSSHSGSAPATPAAIPPQSAAPPQQLPQAKPATGSNQPSFIGAAATPAVGQSGQKTLLGQ